MKIQNTPKGGNPFKRAVSILTVALFLSTNLFASVPLAPARSAGNIKEAGGNPSQDPSSLFPDAGIRIPAELGLIEESFRGTSGKTTLYIQDAHESLEVQENIAKILHYLVSNYGVKTVFEEGYEGPVPTDKYFGSIKDPKIKEKVSYFLMDHLRLGGAEFAHINKTRDFELLGADSLELHKKNIEQYRFSAAKKETVTRDLKALASELKALTDSRFPKELKEWLKMKEQFDAKRLDLFTYLERTMALLGERAEEKDLGLMGFILEAIRSKDPAVIEKAKRIDAREVFGELIKLEQAVAGIYLRDADAKRLFEYSKVLSLLNRLKELQVSQEEYEAVKENLKAFDTESFARFIFAQAPKTLVLSRMWERNIKDALSFYEIAAARDGAVSNAFGRYYSGKRGEQGKPEVTVLVYGGFHKENIKRILEAQGMSYLIVRPRMTQLSPRHEEYYKRLMTEGRLPYELPENLRMATRAESRIEVWDGNAALARAELGIMTSVAAQMPYADRPSLILAMERGLRASANRSSYRSEMRSMEEVSQEVSALVMKLQAGQGMAGVLRPYLEHVPGVTEGQISETTREVEEVYNMTREAVSEELRDVFDRAFALGVILHADQPRASKGDSRPYIIHVAGVVRLLFQEFGLRTEIADPVEVRDALAAAWLHDTIEDGKKGRWGKSRIKELADSDAALREEIGQLIQTETNPNVLTMVRALSKPDYEGSALTDEIQIEAQYYRDLGGAPIGTQLIKASDFSFNLGDLRNHPDRTFPRKFFLKRLEPVLGFLPGARISPEAKSQLIQFIRRAVDENNEANLRRGDPVKAPPVLTEEQEAILDRAEAVYGARSEAREENARPVGGTEEYQKIPDSFLSARPVLERLGLLTFKMAAVKEQLGLVPVENEQTTPYGGTVYRASAASDRMWIFSYSGDKIAIVNLSNLNRNLVLAQKIDFSLSSSRRFDAANGLLAVQSRGYLALYDLGARDIGPIAMTRMSRDGTPLVPAGGATRSVFSGVSDFRFPAGKPKAIEIKFLESEEWSTVQVDAGEHPEAAPGDKARSEVRASAKVNTNGFRPFKKDHPRKYAIRRFVETLPVANGHTHFGSSVPFETVWQLALERTDIVWKDQRYLGKPLLPEVERVQQSMRGWEKRRTLNMDLLLEKARGYEQELKRHPGNEAAQRALKRLKNDFWRWMTIPKKVKLTLDDFTILYNIIGVLTKGDSQLVERLSHDIGIKNYQDGVRYLELRASLSAKPTKDEMKTAILEQLTAVSGGLRRAEQEVNTKLAPDAIGLETRIVVTFAKNYDVPTLRMQAEALTEVLKENPALIPWVVAIDFANSERLKYPSELIGVVGIIHQYNRERAEQKIPSLKITFHIGEDVGDSEDMRSLESILRQVHEAFRLLGADQIGHGTILGVELSQFKGKAIREHVSERMFQILYDQRRAIKDWRGMRAVGLTVNTKALSREFKTLVKSLQVPEPVKQKIQDLAAQLRKKAGYINTEEFEQLAAILHQYRHDHPEHRVPVTYDAKRLEQVKRGQWYVLDKITKHRKVIEMNPTVNTRIGPMHDYGEHHAHRIEPFEYRGSMPGYRGLHPRFTINPDNPTILSVNTRYELWKLGYSMVLTNVEIARLAYRGFLYRLSPYPLRFDRQIHDFYEMYTPDRSEVRDQKEASPATASQSKAAAIKPWQVLQLKQDVIAVVEQARIDALPLERFRELLEIARLNNGKLHLVVPGALWRKYSERVAELRKVASVYDGFPQIAASEKIPVIGFSDMEHDTLSAFQKRLPPRLAGRMKDSAFGLNQAGSFGVGILYALKDVPSEKLRPNKNGFRYDRSGWFAAQILEVLQAYTVITTSA